jgi:hypothetical protein
VCVWVVVVVVVGSSKLTLLSAYCIWSCYEQFVTIFLCGTMQSHPFSV